MVKEKGKEKVIERIKDKAEVFSTNNIKAFIRDFSDNYYFCNLLFVGDIYLMIYDFKRREKVKLYWQDIVEFQEYKEKEESDGN